MPVSLEVSELVAPGPMEPVGTRSANPWSAAVTAGCSPLRCRIWTVKADLPLDE